jgi:uncharacterized protein with HEPN domain
MSFRSDSDRLQDILNAISSIQHRTENIDFTKFSDNETIVKAVLYDLIIIGEAAINVLAKSQALAPQIP